MALTLTNAKKNITATTEGTADTVYTATANQQKITSIRATNTDVTNSVDISVFIVNTAVNYYIGKVIPIPAGSALNLIGGDAINVSSGDVIKAYSSVGAGSPVPSVVDIIVSYAEIS